MVKILLTCFLKIWDWRNSLRANGALVTFKVTARPPRLVIKDIEQEVPHPINIS